MMNVFRAGLGELDEVAQLFDQYRVFYQAASDIQAAKDFLRERLQKEESVIFAARKGDCLVGFTQLYPSFSSVSMKPIWILNDLFVEPTSRKQGVAQLLMATAEDFARKSGAIRLALSTQVENLVAQSLYESRGYIKDQAFYHYTLSL
ncbi:GCN5-related N-acetyltransferase [[Leptolyngbya] sp. PCC 7376]|uniref:GNAT family N-acetyltransferase n=1 Tax=[Leptolyngbya] sp. PCC 7376 TaxID=111781 RepID=UPI00029EDCC5|nr:GNAT family N-acetyltransferase [[Leptolyngbya] sp. PCC 7376]AFY36483.1 GCN5-related N-acetyltransferase [[Leptolyngbya] sp. PCC 7376]